RCAARGFDARRSLVLGVLLAGFALSRTEGVLLGLCVGAGMMLGGLDRSSRYLRARNTLLLAVPGVVLVGSWLLFSRWYFGAWLPVSGHVKEFYEETWGRNVLHGGVVESIGWHVDHVRKLALAPMRDGAHEWLRSTLGWPGLAAAHKATFYALIAVGCVCAGVTALRALSRTCPRGAPGFVAVFAAYTIVHLVLMGTRLPHFTEYGTWYFATEILLGWLILGVLIGCAVEGVRGLSRERVGMAPTVVALAFAGSAVPGVVGSLRDADRQVGQPQD